jgi:hypothetical protein
MKQIKICTYITKANGYNLVRSREKNGYGYLQGWFVGYEVGVEEFCAL